MIALKCQQCKKEYLTFLSRKNGKFCSKNCKNLAACKPKIKCVVCSKEVKKRGRNCCSIWCRGKFQTIRKIEENTTHCTNCNKEIVKRIKIQKRNKFGVFCNLRCSSDYKSKYSSNKRKRICRICNKIMDKRIEAKYCSKKCSDNASKGKPNEGNLSENNGQWRGDKVGPQGLHIWVKRRKPKPESCVRCKIREAYDLANISQEYKRDINDFEWLCRRCHMIEDGRMNNLNNYR